MYDNHNDNNIILTQPQPYAGEMPTGPCRGETCTHLAQPARHDGTHEFDLAALRAEEMKSLMPLLIESLPRGFKLVLPVWHNEYIMTRGCNGSRLPAVRDDYLRISRDPWSVAKRDERLVTSGWNRSNVVEFSLL